jgi:predicted outer membrane protein
VRGYAEMLLERRARARSEQADLPFLPSASADSRRIERHAAHALSLLQAERGRDFDLAYLRLQIEEQRDFLDALRERLQPAAQQRQLRRYLAELASQVAGQLAMGERLQQELEDTSPLHDALSAQRDEPASPRGRAHTELSAR